LAARIGRNQYWRRKKYEAKVDGSVSEVRFDALATSAQALHTSMQNILVPHEEAAKQNILEPAGVSSNEIPFYLDAMREFCRICRTFTSQTKNNECYNTYCRWKSKGVNSNLLIQLAAQCGCDLWEYYSY
jgi:hypothetical protein